MTLREGLQELTEQLREQGKMVVLLDAILAQTAAADAERDRLARIGGLVEELARHTRCFTNDHDDSGLYIEVGIPSGGITLLDALEALKQKMEGK